jgi:hypothetical protein
MAERGAQPGNQNAARGRPWRDAINKALDLRTKSRVDGKREIDALAEKLLDAVAAGDLAALREFGDRIEGKPTQPIGGDDELPAIKVEGAIQLVRPASEG